MKSSYIIYFFAILTIILLSILYIIEIPSPSTIVTEEYKLKLQ